MGLVLDFTPVKSNTTNMLFLELKLKYGILYN